jgi:uncharacterized RDD family membrane protein YckC
MLALVLMVTGSVAASAKSNVDEDFLPVRASMLRGSDILSKELGVRASAPAGWTWKVGKSTTPLLYMAEGPEGTLPLFLMAFGYTPRLTDHTYSEFIRGFESEAGGPDFRMKSTTIRPATNVRPDALRVDAYTILPGNVMTALYGFIVRSEQNTAFVFRFSVADEPGADMIEMVRSVKLIKPVPRLEQLVNKMNGVYGAIILCLFIALASVINASAGTRLLNGAMIAFWFLVAWAGYQFYTLVKSEVPWKDGYVAVRFGLQGVLAILPAYFMGIREQRRASLEAAMRAHTALEAERDARMAEHPFTYDVWARLPAAPALPKALKPLPLAGLSTRCGAALIDALAVTGIAGVVAALFYTNGPHYLNRTGLPLVTAILAMGLYFVASWTFFSATPGQQVLGVRVVSDGTNDELTFGQAFVRAWAHLASLAAVPLFAIGFLNSRRRVLSDFAAGSVVVRAAKGGRGLQMMTALMLMFLFLFAGVLFASRSTPDTAKIRLEGEKFGRDTFADMALIEAINRFDACRTVECFTEVNAFLKGALETSQSAVSLCEDVPDPKAKRASMAWQRKQCRRMDRAGVFCPGLVETIQESCWSLPGHGAVPSGPKIQPATTPTVSAANDRLLGTWVSRDLYSETHERVIFHSNGTLTFVGDGAPIKGHYRQEGEKAIVVRIGVGRRSRLERWKVVSDSALDRDGTRYAKERL